MFRFLVAGAALSVCGGAAAWAQDDAMQRVLVCKGQDASMELYLPYRTAEAWKEPGKGAVKPVIGFYALDLTAAGKGKALERVRVNLSQDRGTVVVNQFTRKLPPTKINVKGDTVDFDKRFGTKAKCGPFNGE